SNIATGTVAPTNGGTGVSDFAFSGTTHKACSLNGVATSGDLVSFDSSGNCSDSGTNTANIVTASGAAAFANKTFNAEGPGNSLGLTSKAFFSAAGCSSGTG